MELETDRQISAFRLAQAVCEPRAPHPPSSCTWPPPLVLRNGSARDRPLPQVLEAQQHGQRPFMPSDVGKSGRLLLLAIKSCFRLRHRPSSMKSCDAQSLASQLGIIPAASVS
jgi:hypothetical protein